MHIKKVYSQYLKRFFDIVIAGLAIIILWPFLLILAILIKLDSPGAVFFKQKRIGKGKTFFTMLKYRTMRADAPHDVPTHIFSDSDTYITKLGKILRKTSLDELPQIFNILLGQMSIVGPRPALWNQDDLVAERDKYGANDVTPGLTGWAQVNGRDELEIDEKARFDGEYCANIGFKMDWTCFWMSFGNVLKRKGIVEGGNGVVVKQVNNQGNDTARRVY